MSVFDYVKIQSPDGIGQGTTVTCKDTGEEINGVEKISIVIAADDINRATIQIACSCIDIDAKAVYYIMSLKTGDMKAVRRIEFADGEVIEL